MIGVPGSQLKAAAYRIPSEVLIHVVENFSTADMVTATHVSRLWRSMLLHCPTLWARLDMVCFEENALTIVPHLLPRSESKPLELSLHIRIIRDPNYAVTVEAFCLALAPHVHRLRRLSCFSLNCIIAAPLFDVLGPGAPILQTLDLAVARGYHELAPAAPEDVFMHMPRLSCVRWHGCQLPASLNALSRVTHLHICRNCLPVDSMVFDLFPCARSMRIDNCDSLHVLGTVPTSHPVEWLELAVETNDTLPIPLSWSDLRQRRCTEIPVLVLRNCNLATLFAACQDDFWSVLSMTINGDEDVDAVLRAGTRECRMIGLRGVCSALAGKSVQRLMHTFPCLRALERLEMSLTSARAQPLVPQLCMRALTTLVILCARRKPQRRRFGIWMPHSLLDPDVLAVCGKLQAPKLATLALEYYPHCADWQDTAYDGVVDPAGLAEFIREHIQIDGGGGLLPELRIDTPKVRLADDADGMAALTSVVGTIVHGL